MLIIGQWAWASGKRHRALCRRDGHWALGIRSSGIVGVPMADAKRGQEGQPAPNYLKSSLGVRCVIFDRVCFLVRHQFVMFKYQGSYCVQCAQGTFVNVMTAFSWGSASASSNECISNDGGHPDTVAPTLLQRLPATRRRDFQNRCEMFRTCSYYCQLCQPGNTNKFLLAYVLFWSCSFPFEIRIGAWGLGIGRCALGIGHWAWASGTRRWNWEGRSGKGQLALGIWHWESGIGHWALQACPWPTPNEDKYGNLPRSLRGACLARYD